MATEQWEDSLFTYVYIDDEGVRTARPYTEQEVIDALARMAAAQASADSRKAKITGAKIRAREIVTLAQTPAARTSTAWTQVQRVAILDGIKDLATMLSWLADDLLKVPEPPD